MAKPINLTEADIEYLKERMKEDFLTRDEFNQFKNELFDRLDVITGNTKASLEALEILAPKVADHEERLESIESKLGFTP